MGYFGSKFTTKIKQNSTSEYIMPVSYLSINGVFSVSTRSVTDEAQRV